MLYTIVISISLIFALWFITVLAYKFIIIKIMKKIFCFVKQIHHKVIIKALIMIIGLSVSFFLTLWIIFGLAGSIEIHLFNSIDYDKKNDLLWMKYYGEIPDDFETQFNEITSYEGNEFIVKDADNQKLQYHAYRQDSSSPINKVVVVVHGSKGAYYTTYPYIYALSKVPALNSNTLFVSFDARGWYEGKKRGDSTYGKKEATDLLQIIRHVEKIFKPSEIITYGLSLGGGTIYNLLLENGNEMAESNVKKSFIIDSGYYNLKDQLIFYVNQFLGVNLGSIVMSPALWLYGLDTNTKMSFNAYEAVSTLNVDLMLLHSQADKIVNWKFSCDINKARNNNNLNSHTKTWITPLAEGIHHVSFFIEKKNEFQKYVGEFLNDNFIDVGAEDCE